MLKKLLYLMLMFSFMPFVYAEEEWDLEIQYRDEAGNRFKQSIELNGLELEFRIENRIRNKEQVDENQPKNKRSKFEVTQEEADEIVKVLKASLTAYISNIKKDEEEHKSKDGYADVEIKYESSEGNVEFQIEFKAKNDESHKALFDLLQKYYQRTVEGENL